MVFPFVLIAVSSLLPFTEIKIFLNKNLAHNWKKMFAHSTTDNWAILEGLFVYGFIFNFSFQPIWITVTSQML